MITADVPIRASDIASHYDELDIVYRGVWGEHVHHGLWESGRESSDEAVVNMAMRVIAKTCIGTGDRVCDIGCGYGATARMLARDFGAEVDAITISARQCALAQALAKAGDRVRFVHGDWLANDFATESYDAAIAIESSEHMASLARFFEEARRVLKPGGRLVIAAWLSANESSPWQQRHLLEPICREGRLVHLGTERDYRNMMSSIGFQEIKFEDFSQCVARTWTLCITRFLRALPFRTDYQRILFSRLHLSRVFAKTIFRIRLAYACGAMRYGIFSGVR